MSFVLLCVSLWVLIGLAITVFAMRGAPIAVEGRDGFRVLEQRNVRREATVDHPLGDTVSPF
ncbi:MAG: hypothetical protein V4773_07485 [Verrucomicrobiota bacterium]